LNCFVTVIVTRRQSFAAMQLAGAPRRTLIVIGAIEACLVAAIATLIAAAVAVVTLSPILHHSVGVWFPRVGSIVLALWVAAVGAVVGLGMVIPIAVTSRARPIRTVMGGE
jgi:hypothetical protein